MNAAPATAADANTMWRHVFIASLLQLMFDEGMQDCKVRICANRDRSVESLEVRTLPVPVA
jgi:hypothetical protein